MFCMLKKKKIYPAYVSKHNSNCEKQVILLMILNNEKQRHYTTTTASVLMPLSRLAIFALICSRHFTQSHASSFLKPYRSRSFFMHSSHDFLGRSFFLFTGISCSMTSRIWEVISRWMT